MSRHYTAIIRVMGVDSPPPVTPTSYPKQADRSDKQKDAREVASITIRADSIKSLITKAQQHLELVEDTDG
jgi:hypothetical protein